MPNNFNYTSNTLGSEGIGGLPPQQPSESQTQELGTGAFDFDRFLGSQHLYTLPEPTTPSSWSGTPPPNSLAAPSSSQAYSGSSQPTEPAHFTPESTQPAISQARNQQPATQSQFSAQSNSVSQRTRGRRPGTRNWSEAEIGTFFRVLDERLPMGQKGWAKVTDDYNMAVTPLGYASRDSAQLRRKLKKWVKEAGGKKPTGKSKKAKVLLRAWEINGRIYQRYGAGVLDDSARDDAEDDEDDDDDLGDETLISSSVTSASTPLPLSLSSQAASATPSSWVVEKAYKSSQATSQTSDSGRSRATAATRTLNSLSNAFDPEQIRARDQSRAELNALLVQLNNSQAEVQRLRAENDHFRDQLLQERLRAQRAEDRLDMEKQIFALKLQLYEKQTTLNVTA